MTTRSDPEKRATVLDLLQGVREYIYPVGRLIFAPDWRPITWTEAERAKGQAWGLKTIESFHTHGTPPV